MKSDINAEATPSILNRFAAPKSALKAIGVRLRQF